MDGLAGAVLNQGTGLPNNQSGIGATQQKGLMQNQLSFANPPGSGINNNTQTQAPIMNFGVPHPTLNPTSIPNPPVGGQANPPAPFLQTDQVGQIQTPGLNNSTGQDLSGVLGGLGQSTGLSSFLNDYTNSQMAQYNNEFSSPQGIENQVQSRINAAGLGESPLGVSLANTAANNYFTSANAAIGNTNAGMFGRILSVFPTLISSLLNNPFTQEKAGELGQQFMYSNAGQQANLNKTIGNTQTGIDVNQYNQMAQTARSQAQQPTMSSGTAGLSGGFGGSAPGLPSMQQMPQLMQAMQSAIYGGSNSGATSPIGGYDPNQYDPTYQAYQSTPDYSNYYGLDPYSQESSQ